MTGLGVTSGTPVTWGLGGWQGSAGTAKNGSPAASPSIEGDGAAGPVKVSSRLIAAAPCRSSPGLWVLAHSQGVLGVTTCLRSESPLASGWNPDL